MASVLPSAALCELPGELLTLIAAKSRPRDLKNLRLTCRAFNAIGRPMLFEHILIFADTESLARMRAVADHQELRHLVRSVEYSGCMVFFRRSWKTDIEQWLEDGVLRNDARWTFTYHGGSFEGRWDSSPIDQRPSMDDDLRATHTNWLKRVSQQGVALRSQLDYTESQYAFSLFDRLHHLVFDAGWFTIEPPGPGDLIFDETLIGRTPVGGYKRHTRQLWRILAAASRLTPRLRSLAAYGVPYATFSEDFDERITANVPEVYDAWDRLKSLTLHFCQFDEYDTEEPGEIHGCDRFARDMLHRARNLEYLDFQCFHHSPSISSISKHVKQAEYRYEIASSAFSRQSADRDSGIDMEEHYHFPALQTLRMSGVNGTAVQWNTFLEQLNDSIINVSLKGCDLIMGRDIHGAIRLDCQVMHDIVWDSKATDGHDLAVQRPHYDLDLEDALLDLGWTANKPDTTSISEILTKRNKRAETAAPGPAD